MRWHAVVRLILCERPSRRSRHGRAVTGQGCRVLPPVPYPTGQRRPEDADEAYRTLLARVRIWDVAFVAQLRRPDLRLR